jgi:hypothetical protein
MKRRNIKSASDSEEINDLISEFYLDDVDEIDEMLSKFYLADPDASNDPKEETKELDNVTSDYWLIDDTSVNTNQSDFDIPVSKDIQDMPFLKAYRILSSKL